MVAVATVVATVVVTVVVTVVDVRAMLKVTKVTKMSRSLTGPRY